MQRRTFLQRSLGALSCLVPFGCRAAAVPSQDPWAVIATKLRTVATRDRPGQYPFLARPGAIGWETKPPSYWTSGFFPAMLWLMYGRTQDASLIYGDYYFVQALLVAGL